MKDLMGHFLVFNLIKEPNIDQLLLKMGKKLRRYYQSHRIIYKTNFSRVQHLQSTNCNMNKFLGKKVTIYTTDIVIN